MPKQTRTVEKHYNCCLKLIGLLVFYQNCNINLYNYTASRTELVKNLYVRTYLHVCICYVGTGFIKFMQHSKSVINIQLQMTLWRSR